MTVSPALRWFLAPTVMTCSLFLLVAGEVRSQNKPDILQQQYPSPAEFQLDDTRDRMMFKADPIADEPAWQPITTGKSDQQLVDQIDQLRTAHMQPEFVQVHAFDLAGAPILAADVTLDGKTLVTYDQQHRLAVWNLTDGSKVADLPLENGTDKASVAISADGRQVVFGDENRKVYVFDIASTTAIWKQTDLKYPIAKVAISQHAKNVAAVDVKGNMYVVSPDEKRMTMYDDSMPDYRPQIDLAVAENRSFGKTLCSEVAYRVNMQLGQHDQVFTRGPSESAATDVTDNRLLITDQQGVRVYRKSPRNYLFFEEVGLLYLPVTSARFDSQQRTAWLVTRAGVDIRVVQYLSLGCTVRFPETQDPIAQALVAPDADTLILLSPKGKATLWKLSDNVSLPRAEMIHQMASLLEEDRYDALELLAKHWTKIDFDPYSFAMPPYLSLVDFVQRYQSRHFRDHTKLARFQEYVVAHSEAEFFRVSLVNMAFNKAWEARGSGYSGTVDAKGWEGFRANLKQAGNMLMPLFQRNQPPCPEAFFQLVVLAKAYQWPSSTVDYFIDIAQKHYPGYVRIYAEVGEMRLPRWGGGWYDSSKFAAKMADAIGGPEGDIVYASVADFLHNYHGWDDTFRKLNFDAQRVAKGLAEDGYRPQNQSMRRLCTALWLARKNNDQQLAHDVAEHIAQQNRLPGTILWSPDLEAFEETMSWAMGRPFEYNKLVLPPPSQREVTAHDLALVDEIYKLSHSTETPQWKELYKFRVGDSKPIKFDVSTDSDSLITLDAEGNVNLWNTRLGENKGQRLAKDFGKQTAVMTTGSQYAVGDDQGNLVIIKSRYGKQVEERHKLRAPIVAIVRGQGERLCAISADNEMLILPEFVRPKWPLAMVANSNIPPVEPISVGLADSRYVLQACRYRDIIATTLLMQAGDKVDRHEATYFMSDPIHIASGRTDYAICAGNNVIAMRVTPSRSGRATQLNTAPLQFAQPIHDARFDTEQRNLWCVADRCVEVRDWERGTLYSNPIPLPPNVDAQDAIWAPSRGRLVNCDADGMAHVWSLNVDPVSVDCRSMRKASELDSRGRFDALEVLGAKWAHENVPSSDGTGDNQYSALIHRMNMNRVVDSDSKVHEAWLRSYLQLNPDSPLIRLTLCDLLMQKAKLSLGGKSLAELTVKERGDYHGLLQECQTVLMPIFHSQDVPPEAYTMMMRLAREIGWDRSQMKSVLTRAQQNFPDYARIYGEACVTLLPANGGNSGESQNYAALVADRVGGEAGDILYCQIATYLADTDKWAKVFDELGFSKPRVLKGLVALAAKYPYRSTLRQGLLLAQELGDKPAGQMMAKQINACQMIPESYRWPDGNQSFDEAMAWAMAP